MYNNKKYILAQSVKENVLEGLSSSRQGVSDFLVKNKQDLIKAGVEDIPKFIKDIKAGRIQQYIPTLNNLLNSGVDLFEFFAPLQLGDATINGILALLKNEKIKLPKGLLPIKKFNVPDKNVGTLKGLGLGTAATYGTEALFSSLEEMKGSLNIYKDYHSDYNKILLEILRLLPNNQEIKPMIRELYDMGNAGLELIIESKKIKDELAKKPIKKSNSLYNIKIAIKGKANWGSYLHNFLSGAAGGAAATKTWQGALLSGLGDAFYDIGTDVYFNLQDNDYKATALAKELEEKAATLYNQVLKYEQVNPWRVIFWASLFIPRVQNFHSYVRTNIYKPSKSKLNPDYYRNLIDKKLGRNK